MSHEPKSFFDGAAFDPGAAPETIETLFESASVRIERIASHGQPSPAGFWYDQAADEWVMLVRGLAQLEYEEGGKLELRAGDWLMIPKRVKHRVAAVSDDALWLAIHAG